MTTRPAAGLLPLLLLAWAGRGGAASLSLEEVVREALAKSPEVARARAEAAQAALAEPSLWALTDPRIEALYDVRVDKAPRAAPAFQGEDSREQALNLGLSQSLLTGTELSLDWSNARLVNDAAFRVIDPTVDSRLTASLRQPLLKNFWGRPDKARLGEARASARAAEAGLHRAEETEALSAARAHVEYFYAGEALAVVERTLVSAERLVKNYREKQAYGLVEDSDLVQAETLLEAERTEKMLALSRVERARLELLSRLRRQSASDAGEVAVSAPILSSGTPGSLEEALRTGLARRPDLRAARAALEAAAWGLRISRLNFLPDLSVIASYGVAGLDTTYPASWDDLKSGEHRVASAGVTLSVPLGFEREKVEARSSELSLESQRESLREAEQAALREVRDAWERRRVADDRREARTRIVALENRKLQAEIANARRGRSSTDVLVRFQQDLQRAEALALTAESEALLAELELRRAAGTLLNPWAQSP